MHIHIYIYNTYIYIQQIYIYTYKYNYTYKHIMCIYLQTFTYVYHDLEWLSSLLDTRSEGCHWSGHGSLRGPQGTCYSCELGPLSRKPGRIVDVRNPAPVDRWFIPLFIGFQPSKAVQDFFHPPDDDRLGFNSKPLLVDDSLVLMSGGMK